MLAMSKCVSQDSELGEVTTYYSQGEASAPAGKLLVPKGAGLCASIVPAMCHLRTGNVLRNFIVMQTSEYTYTYLQDIAYHYLN